MIVIYKDICCTTFTIIFKVHYHYSSFVCSFYQKFLCKKMRGGSLWQLGQSITRRLAQADKKTIARRHFSADADLKKTVLYDFHVANGAKMVPFAGWSMPIQYKDSIMESTLNCRQNGSLFDVSHMCGLSLMGKDCIPFLEKLVIADVAGLAPGTGTLTVFTNEQGGAIDDSVITKVKDDHIYLVVNAGCRDKDLAHIEEHMKSYTAKGGDVSWHIHDERSLLALQVCWILLCFPCNCFITCYTCDEFNYFCFSAPIFYVSRYGFIHFFKHLFIPTRSPHELH